MTKRYARISYKASGHKRLRVHYARFVSSRPNFHTFERVSSTGEERSPREMIILADADIRRAQVAEWDLHYGDLRATTEPFPLSN